MLILVGLLLVYPRPLFDALGAGLVGVVALLQWLRRDQVLAPARAG